MREPLRHESWDGMLVTRPEPDNLSARLSEPCVEVLRGTPQVSKRPLSNFGLVKLLRLVIGEMDDIVAGVFDQILEGITFPLTRCSSNRSRSTSATMIYSWLMVPSAAIPFLAKK